MRRHPFLLLLMVILLCAGAGRVNGQTMTKAWVQERVDSLEAAMEQVEITKYDLAFLSKIDTVGRCRAFLRNEALTPQFRIGSLSKVFVALGLLKLQEQGRLSLNDPVSLHLDRPKLDNPWEATNPVRIAHLLEHSAGLDDMHFNEYYHFEEQIVPLSEALERNPRSKRVRWLPGTCSAYSNVGYAIAGRIIEEVTDTAFATWMWTNLLQPLGLNHTCYPPCPSLHSETGLADGPFHEYLYAPSLGMVSTVNDLKRLCTLLLWRGNLNGVQYFQPVSIDRMFRSETTRSSNKGWWDGDFGLGFKLWSRGDQVRARATGMVDGYLSFINIAPSSGKANVLLCASADRQERFVNRANDILWFPYEKAINRPEPSSIGQLEEGTYRLLSVRHSVLDFHEDLYAQIRIERVGKDWVGHLTDGTASVLVPSSVIGNHVAGRDENRVFVDRDSSGFHGIQINGNYFVPTSRVPGTLLRAGAQAWSWMVWAYMVIYVVFTWLRPRKEDQGKTRPFLGMLVIVPYWMFRWGGSILSGRDYYMLGDLSGQSLVLFLLTWAAPLVSVGLPIHWWGRYRQGNRSVAMYAGIPIMIGNLICSGYLIYYGMIPFASWSY